MPRYLIHWNAGYGENYEPIEADDIEEARKLAYEQWREEAESNGDYGAKLLTPEVARSYGVDEEGAE